MAASSKLANTRGGPSPAVELYQLRTFVTVAREGNLTRAAEKLFTSQPAVSAQIKALEEEFGLKLFERTPTGMHPTPAGEELWTEAERLLSASKDLAARASSLRGTIGGTLRLGLNNDIGVLRTGDLLAQLARKHPALRFELVYGTSGALREAVLARELDVAFYEGATADRSLALVTLTHFELVIVLPPAWEAELDTPDWHKLATKPWIVGAPGCSFHRHLRELALQHGFEPDARFQLNDEATVLTLVAGGFALALTSREILRTQPRLATSVVVWPHFHQQLPLSLCFLAARREDPAIKAIVDAARALWTESTSRERDDAHARTA
jgi:DNA-binding transcriptional LysR family regulator